MLFGSISYFKPMILKNCKLLRRGELVQELFYKKQKFVIDLF